MWRVARSLLQLRAEVDAAAPRRFKGSDGTIGDAAHAATNSDHNPDGNGVVHALDLTHDPAHGADMGRIADIIRTHRHPALTYLIFNRRIASPMSAPPWSWRHYTGDSPHTDHLHISVGGPSSDDTTTWGVLSALGGVGGPPHVEPAAGHPPGNAHPGARTLTVGMRGPDVAYVQRFVGASKCGAADGIYGPHTQAGVRWYQQMRGLHADGIVGPATWRHMRIRGVSA